MKEVFKSGWFWGILIVVIAIMIYACKNGKMARGGVAGIRPIGSKYTTCHCEEFGFDGVFNGHIPWYRGCKWACKQTAQTFGQ